MRYIIVLILSMIFCSLSLAGTRDPKKADEQYITYGSEFSCIFKLKCVTSNGTVYYASAVAIDDNWLLTAAHVLSHSKDISITVDNAAIKIDKVVTHKDFIASNYGYYDIALCHVEKPFKLLFYPSLYRDKNEVGKVCSIAGYGSYGTFETGVTGSDGIKRAGSNTIDTIDRHLIICTPSRPNSKGITELEYMIANGDSGGGLFIGNQLAGINSCVIAVDKQTNSNYGDESGHTRVSQFVDWITENKK